MQVITTALAILAAVAGAVAVWYFKKTFGWLVQMYRDSRQKREEAEARRESSDRNRRGNSEHDRMREIDGR